MKKPRFEVGLVRFGAVYEILKREYNATERQWYYKFNVHGGRWISTKQIAAWKKRVSRAINKRSAKLKKGYL